MPRDLLADKRQPRDLLAGPESASQPNILQRAASKALEVGGAINANPVVRAVSPTSVLFGDDDESRAARQGATFGFADEVSGVLAGEAAKLNARERAKVFAKEKPVTSGALNVAGALAPAIATAPLTGAVNTGRGAAAVGAVEGGAFGLGTAEGSLADRAPSAAIGAGAGAVGGFAFQKLANGAMNFFRARQSKTLVTDNTRAAFTTIRRVLEEDKGSRGQAEAFLRKWVKSGASPDELFDELSKGETGKFITREVASRNPTSAVRFIDEFKNTQSPAIREGLRKSLKGDKSVKAGRETLRVIRETQASELFDAARNTAVPDGFVDDLLGQSDDFAKAYKAAQRELTNDPGATPFDVLKITKENLDDRVNSLFRSGKRGKAGRVQIPRDELRNRLTQLSDDYSEGLRVWAGTKQVDEAMDLGRKFTRPSYRAQDLADDLARMNDSQKEFHRVAVAEEFEELIDRTRDNANLARFVKTQQMRDKLRILFKDAPDEGDAFINLIQGSAERFDNRSFADPRIGSQTEPRLRGRQIFDEAVQGRVTRSTLEAAQNPLGVPRQVFNAARRGAVERKKQKVSEVIARAIFEGAEDPFSQAATTPRLSGVAAAAPLQSRD